MPLFIDIKVIPQSGRQVFVLDKNNTLKCFIKAAPEDGKANKEVIEFLSKILHIAKSNIEIVSGLTSRKKRIAIEINMNYEQFLELLGIGAQQKLF